MTSESSAHSVVGQLCMTHEEQEGEVRSLDLNEGDIVFNALFSQRNGVLEDVIIWLCWS